MRFEPIAPRVSPADIERVVRRKYPHDQFAAVMAVLQTCCPRDTRDAADRVRVAVLRLSAGRVDALRRCVEIANHDSTGLLARVETPGHLQIEVRIRNGKVPKELQQRFIEEDRIQYESWLQKSG